MAIILFSFTEINIKSDNYILKTMVIYIWEINIIIIIHKQKKLTCQPFKFPVGFLIFYEQFRRWNTIFTAAEESIASNNFLSTGKDLWLYLYLSVTSTNLVVSHFLHYCHIFYTSANITFLNGKVASHLNPTW